MQSREKYMKSQGLIFTQLNRKPPDGTALNVVYMYALQQ